MASTMRAVLRRTAQSFRRISMLIPRQSPIRNSSSFRVGPAPPRLPPEQQAEFERLQRIANTQEGFNPTSTPSSLYDDPAHELTPAPAADPVSGADEAVLSQPLRKGAPPEFEGDVNPKTGEVGGPKNEPLRWGANSDYSFNGRVTDF
ncbi:hypothetical protein DL769_006299 [Monosporascus sp. CRB-8-3]|nr:hypothetical protein DL769_006299 [Monosporascus sp. CRB-8-3]